MPGQAIAWQERAQGAGLGQAWHGWAKLEQGARHGVSGHGVAGRGKSKVRG